MFRIPPDPLSGLVMGLVHLADATTCSCPSMHCAFAAFITITCRELKPHLATYAIGFSLVIGVSCLLTKQHILLDLVPGFCLGSFHGMLLVAALRWWYPPFLKKELHKKEEDRGVHEEDRDVVHYPNLVKKATSQEGDDVSQGGSTVLSQDEEGDEGSSCVAPTRGCDVVAPTRSFVWYPEGGGGDAPGGRENETRSLLWYPDGRGTLWYPD